MTWRWTGAVVHMRGVRQAHLLTDRHATGNACATEHVGPAKAVWMRGCGLGSGGQVQCLEGLLGLLLAAREAEHGAVRHVVQHNGLVLQMVGAINKPEK